MERYISFIQRFRFVIIVVSILLMILMGKGAGILFSNQDTDYRAFFSSDNPELMAYEFIQETYTKADNALLVIAPKEGAVSNNEIFTNQRLEAIQWLTEESWQLPYSSRVDSISNYQHTEAEGDDMLVTELYEDANSLEQTDRDRISDIVINEKLLVRRLIAADGNAAGVNVTFSIPDGANQTILFKEIADKIYKLRKQFNQQYPNLELYLTGIVMMNQAFADAGQSDVEKLVPIMYIIVMIILFMMLRSIVPVIGTMIVIFMSIAWAYGFAGYAGFKLTSPIFSVMNIVLTLAVADSVHLLMTFVQGMRNGVEKYDALKESIRINSWPIFLTSVTTAIGFLTLNFSETPPFRDLGNISAFGVMAAWLFSMTFLPALILALPVHIKPTQQQKQITRRFMSSLAEFVIAKHKLILTIFIPTSIVILFGIVQNELDDDFVKYFDKRIEFRTDTDKAYEVLTGINNIQYSLPAKGSNGIADPEYLSTLEKFVEWHREQEIVLNVNSINDVLKRLNKNMHGDNEQWFAVPENKELAAQYLLLYEMSLPYGLDLNDQIDVDKSASRIIVTTKNGSSNETLALASAGKKWLEENAPEYMQAVGASPTVMFANVGKRNINTMLFGTLTALLLISFILIFALRSVKVGLLSLIPNILPIGLAFGVFGYLVGQVGLAASIVAAICMGIVVDDTVHFLSKYLRARQEKGLNAEDSIRYAFSTVGVALWVTSVVLVLGFLVLAFSSFLINSQLGVLVFITISLALITDFLLLPPLLMFFDKDK